MNESEVTIIAELTELTVVWNANALMPLTNWLNQYWTVCFSFSELNGDWYIWTVCSEGKLTCNCFPVQHGVYVICHNKYVLHMYVNNE